MTTIRVGRDQRVRHESGHVACLHCLGVGVDHVDVLDHDGGGQGFTRHSHRVTDRATAEIEVKHCIAAWLCEGGDALPDWPPDSRPVTSSDERRVAAIADALDWDEHDWRRLLRATCHLMTDDPFRKTYRKVAGALQTTAQLDGPTLQRLLGPRLERKTFTASAWPSALATPLIQYKVAVRDRTQLARLAERDRTQLARRVERDAKAQRERDRRFDQRTRDLAQTIEALCQGR